MHVPPGGVLEALQVSAPSVKSAASVSVTPLKARAPVPLLVTVTVCAALEVPASCAPKLMLVGVTDTAASVAVPERETACGLPAALSAISRIAVREADARTDGMNVTLTVQFAPERTLGGQLFVSAKSPALAPAMLTPLIASDSPLVFSRVTI